MAILLAFVYMQHQCDMQIVLRRSFSLYQDECAIFVMKDAMGPQDIHVMNVSRASEKLDALSNGNGRKRGSRTLCWAPLRQGKLFCHMLSQG